MALLSRLSIRGFRNIERADLAFPPEGVVVVGDNGQGKTNLLEAVYYFQLLRSMRGARDQDLIHFGANAFHIRAQVGLGGEHELSAAFERRGRKKVVADGAEAKRLSSALGSLPSVVISPRDVELIIGAPSERRRFLDVVLALTSRRYLAALQKYRGSLARRNAALRIVGRGVETEESVAVWEPALAESGAVLLAARVAWMERNEGEFARLAGAIGEPDVMTIRYSTTVANTADAHDELLETFARKRHIDIRRGLTHVGPHRDDVEIAIGGRELRTFGSGGQQRTAAITLRLLEAATIKAHEGSDPVLLLDDPFAELDVRRSAHILGLLHATTTGQTILTVPRASDIPPDLTRLPRWHVRDGIIVGDVGTIEDAGGAA